MRPNARLHQVTIAAIADEAGTHSYYYQGHLARRETMQQARLAWQILFLQPLAAAAVATADRHFIRIQLYL